MNEHFIIGCCYYPEHWPKENLYDDMKRIKGLGFNTVRMGEFSWSMFEKEEGKYDFSFLMKAVRVAEELGLDVILGTPTAAPPKWLTDRYPEVLCRTEDGAVLHHGSRQHHNHTSEVYLRCCAAVTEAMVLCFKDCKNVIGWQIDNELNCHRNVSYSESDDRAFAQWLKEKYHTVEALNRGWGTRFWSLEFNDFSQIECPKKTTTHKNPSLMTDYFLFLSDAVIRYAEVQARILRKHMPHAFITHNGWFRNVDYKKLTDRCLDFLSFDCYPAFGESLREGGGRDFSYRLAQTRGCSEKFLVLEQQAGASGQLRALSPTPLPGQMRLWTYQSIAHGAAGVVYFRYRTALYGAEQLWYGIYDHSGEEGYRSREARQVAEELSRVGKIFLSHRKKAEVAIFSDYHNTCCEQAEPFFANDSRRIFQALCEKNVSVDLVYSAERLTDYKIVLFPHIAIAEEALREQLEAFTRQGGIAILTCRSGTKDRNAHYRPARSPGIFRELAGCSADWFTALAGRDAQSVELGGKRYPVALYYETLETEGAETVAVYTQGFAEGKTAVTKKGNVYYVGFYCGEEVSFYYDLLKTLLPLPAVQHPLLEEVSLGEYQLYLNHGGRPLPLKGYDLLTESAVEEIGPFGVILRSLKEEQG